VATTQKKMETQTEWDQLVYFINYSNEIESMTYGAFCREFGGDETTSPRGIAPRIHIREVEKFVENEDGEITGTEIEFQTWSWGIQGNHPSHIGPDFETEEEAENEVLEHFEYNLEKFDNTPPYYYSQSETEASLIENMEYDLGVDFEVAKSIYSKMQRVKVRRAAFARIAENKRIEAKKESEKFIEIEAQKLFEKRGEIENLFNVTGMSNIEKQAKQVADMKNLISHAGIENGILKAPFWSVFKSVSAKIYESKKSI